MQAVFGLLFNEEFTRFQSGLVNFCNLVTYKLLQKTNVRNT